MANSQQSRDSIERLTEVVSFPLFRRSGMQGHTDFEGKVRTYSCPDLMQTLLRYEGGIKSLWGGGEGSAEGISYRFEDRSPIGLDGSVKQGIMASQSQPHGIRLLFPQSSRAFDIRKEEGNRSGRKICHGIVPERIV